MQYSEQSENLYEWIKEQFCCSCNFRSQSTHTVFPCWFKCPILLCQRRKVRTVPGVLCAVMSCVGFAVPVLVMGNGVGCCSKTLPFPNLQQETYEFHTINMSFLVTELTAGSMLGEGWANKFPDMKKVGGCLPCIQCFQIFALFIVWFGDVTLEWLWCSIPKSHAISNSSYWGCHLLGLWLLWFWWISCPHPFGQTVES